MLKNPRLALLASLLLGFALVAHTLSDPDGWERRGALEAELTEVHAEAAGLDARAEKLRWAVDGLRSRREVQTRVIRDELGYVLPDEITVELPHVAACDGEDPGTGRCPGTLSP